MSRKLTVVSEIAPGSNGPRQREDKALTDASEHAKKCGDLHRRIAILQPAIMF